jgi:hypothetical protein
MKRISLLLITCCVLGACNQTPKSTAFDKFKKHIPYLKLPYKRTCSDSVTHLKLDIPDSIFKKYAPPGASGIIGMLKDTDSYTAIVFSVPGGSIQYPVVQTYNPEGDSINNVAIMDGTCCGTSPDCSGVFWGVIFADQSILMRDSEKVFEKNDTGYSKVNFKIINTSQIYIITKEGYIRLKGDTIQKGI